MRRKSKVFELDDTSFKKVVSESRCIREIVQKLGFIPTSGTMAAKVKQRIISMNLDTSHFKPFSRKVKPRRSLESILVENSSYSNRDRLKIRLVNSKLIDYKCALCGNEGIWNGKPLSLQLHHINGIYNDNRLENLQLLCPNCHAQTDSYSGRNSKKK